LTPERRCHFMSAAGRVSPFEGVMNVREQDRALLSSLEPDDREICEAIVDDFIEAELRVATPAALRMAADLFDEAGRSKPPGQGITGLLIAAILRERAAVLLM
jgi:hypothetical protein